MPATPRSQEEIRDAALAALTEADIPPDAQDYAWADPGTGPPAELAALDDGELDELLAGAPAAPAPPVWPLTYLTPAGSLRPAGPVAGGAPGALPCPAGAGDAGDSAGWLAGFRRDGSGGAAGSLTAVRWMCWRRGWRWPGSPRTATPGAAGWMITGWSGCCGRGGG